MSRFDPGSGVSSQPLNGATCCLRILECSTEVPWQSGRVTRDFGCVLEERGRVHRDKIFCDSGHTLSLKAVCSRIEYWEEARIAIEA